MTEPSIFCPYCGSEAYKVSGKVIYPHRPDLHANKFYQCKPCKAYVGCHKKSGVPLGRLANATLRKAKINAHAAFDPLWRTGILSRSSAYVWLAKQLGIRESECHIGMFDYTTCTKVLVIMAGNKIMEKDSGH